MTGPRIIRVDKPESKSKARPKRDRTTGIRKQAQTGQWAAIRDGRLVGEYGKGIGGMRIAARVAGTSEVV